MNRRSCDGVIAVQRGFGLVEIMISLVLGLLLIGAAGQVFLSSSAAYRFNEALATVQDNGRFALHTIERDLRLSGYSGCTAAPTSAPSVSDAQPYGQVRILASSAAASNIDESYFVARGIDTATGLLPPSAIGGVDGALRLAYMRDYGVRISAAASSLTADLQVSGDTDSFPQGSLPVLFVTDCTRADMFETTGISAANIAHGDSLGKLYGPSSRVMNPYAAVYFVGDTGRDNDAGNDVLALYRREVFPTSPSLPDSQQVVTGISALTLRYGVDSDGDSAPDDYLDATGVNDLSGAENWRDVVSVQVGFIAESDRRAGAAQPVSLDIFDRTVSGFPDDGHVRRVFTTTVALRNRVR